MNAWVAICISLEALVFLVSTLHVQKLKSWRLGSLPYFLFFVFAGELVGFFLAKCFHTNLAFHNVFGTIQMLYYLYLIRANIVSPKVKKVIIWSAALYAFTFIINSIFIQQINRELGSYTFTMGCVLISVWVVYFFYELILSKEVVNYGHHPFFWIGLGLFVFYVCNIPYMSVYNYLAYNYRLIFTAYFIIIEVLGYIMYTFFIIGILCSRTK